jgi:5-methylcytosine-specific restriction endonuclease McrA
VLDKHKKTAVKRAAPKRKPSLPIELRKEIHCRDRSCRFCGQLGARMEVHHINYRSQGGPDANWNLVLLCDEHHRLVHSDKKRWQPLLRAYIWLYYVEGLRGTIAKVERKLASVKPL